MNIDRFRRAFWSPLAAIVFEIPYGLFLLGVDRYDRIIGGQEGLGLRINVLKLRVAIDVLAAFSGLGGWPAGYSPCRAGDCQQQSGKPHVLASPAPSPDYAGCARSTTAVASVVGETRRLRSSKRVGSSNAFCLRPPPLLRTRLGVVTT